MRERVPFSVLLIALAAILFSIGYSFYYHDHPRVDAAGYDQMGWNLARGFGYIEEPANVAAPEKDWGINRVGPGYQFFLAFLYSLFGHHIWVVWILQALLRGVSVILIYYLAREVLPGIPRAWVLAALFFAFAPDLIVVSGLLLTETFFITILLAAMLVALRAIKSFSVPAMLGAGGLWAVAILIRPTALLPFAAFFLYLLFTKKLRAAFCFFLLPLVLVGSWSFYASGRYHRFILTTGVGAYDLWVGNNVGAKGGFEKTPEVQKVRDESSSAELDEISKVKYAEFLTQHPFLFLELQIRKTALYFSLVRPGGLWIHLWSRLWHLRMTVLLSFVWTALLFLIGISGVVLFLKNIKSARARLFMVAALLQPLSVIPIIVETRYRYPLFPFLAVFGAYFVVRYSKSSRPIVILVAIVLLALTGYDIISNFQDILLKAHRVF